MTILKSDADEIKKFDMGPRRGFGSIPVEVKTGKTVWKTSIFPQKGGSYVLPLKKQVRISEGIEIGNIVSLEVKVLN